MPDLTAQQEWDAVAAESRSEETQTPAAAAVAAVDTPTPDPTTETPAIEEAAPAADPYAGFDAETQAKLRAFDALATGFPQFEKTLKETAGRVSSLQSEFAKSRQAVPAGEAPTQRQVAAAAKDPEKWASLKKDFPEWGEGIEAFVDSRVGALAGSGMTAEQVEAAVASKVAASVSEITATLQQDLVGSKYRNWSSIVKTPEFETWFAGQTAEVQALAASPRGIDALEMLDQFHAAKKAPAVRQTRQAVLAAAVTTNAGKTPATTKSFTELSPKEQWNHVAAERARSAA